MNNPSFLRRITLTLGVASALVLPAQAQEATPDTWIATGTLTRAEVQADLAKARATGGMRVFSGSYIEPLRNSKDRDTVRRATREALLRGEVAAISHPTQSGSDKLRKHPQVLPMPMASR